MRIDWTHPRQVMNGTFKHNISRKSFVVQMNHYTAEKRLQLPTLPNTACFPGRIMLTRRCSGQIEFRLITWRSLRFPQMNHALRPRPGINPALISRPLLGCGHRSPSLPRCAPPLLPTSPQSGTKSPCSDSWFALALAGIKRRVIQSRRLATAI